MATLLYFDDEREPAQRLAKSCQLKAECIAVHRFPDGEIKLRLPVDDAGGLDTNLVLYRSLDRPNDKLVALLLAATEARALGAQRILLVAPYLPYMRQDIAFQPGEVVSQKHIGRFLGQLFDGLITVDPHLHRVHTLQEAVPLSYAVALTGAKALAECISQHHQAPLLVGPDAESAQWIASAAHDHGWDTGVCTKVRHGDHDVEIQLPNLNIQNRAVVLLDDVASSGHTLAEAARLLQAAGARSVDVAVTHALFANDADQVIRAAGVKRIWSTDCIAHSSNAVAMAPVMAPAVLEWLQSTSK